MATTPLKRAATNILKLIQDREITGLTTHLRVYGPFPKAAVEATKKVPKGTTAVVLPNPFLPKKNPKSNKWRSPKYSLRRQADMVKLAQAAGTLEAVPPCSKKQAMQLRVERVKSALAPHDSLILERHEKLIREGPKPRELTPQERNSKLQSLGAKIRNANSRLGQIEERLKAISSDEDIAALVVFESNKSSIAEKTEEEIQREKEKMSLKSEQAKLENSVKSAESQQTRIAPQKPQTAVPIDGLTREQKVKVIWAGELKENKVAGSELGTRLYSGKKRMFKGHLWERKRARRMRRHTVLMRDMAARVARYKSYYKKRKPNPLKPSRYTKPPKLPY